MPSAMTMLSATQMVLVVRSCGKNGNILFRCLHDSYLQEVAPRVVMLDGLDTSPRKVFRDRSIFQQHEHVVDAIFVLRIFRPNHNALLAQKERTAKFSDARVADEGFAGIELYDCISREDVANVTDAELDSQFALIELRTAIFISQVGVAALVLLIEPARRDFKP